MDSPLGNPPQLRQAVIGVLRVWRFAIAKPLYSFLSFLIDLQVSLLKNKPL